MGRYTHFLDSNGKIRYIAAHPGCSLEEYMKYNRINIDRLANRCLLPLNLIWQICHGTQNITSDIATLLFYGTGIDSSFWTNLQEHYDQKIKDGACLGYTLEYTYISDLGGDNE